jgi:hypothetical protein
MPTVGASLLASTLINEFNWIIKNTNDTFKLFVLIILTIASSITLILAAV